jgi:hypothetical protein
MKNNIVSRQNKGCCMFRAVDLVSLEKFKNYKALSQIKDYELWIRDEDYQLQITD